MWAYSIREYQLSAPEWLSDERYDVLQALLADRLGLRVHPETRRLSVYVLGASGKAPELREVRAGATAPCG
jgi:hypothetical protein